MASRPEPSRHAPEEVDKYLAAQEPAFRATLEQLRENIKPVAPKATERVSYKIPIFRLKKDFVAISADTNHCGLHTMSKAIPFSIKDELKAVGIWTSGTTLHIKPGAELPIATLDTVMRAHLRELEQD